MPCPERYHIFSSFLYLSRWIKSGIEHLIWLLNRTSKIAHVGDREERWKRMPEGQKSLCFSPREILLVKGHSSASAVPAPAREGPPLLPGAKAQQEKDLLQRLPRLSIYRLVWVAHAARKRVWGKCKHLRIAQEGFWQPLVGDFLKRFARCQVNLEVLASPPFMSLPSILV